jgi:Flp pilus assembly protein TadD
MFRNLARPATVLSILVIAGGLVPAGAVKAWPFGDSKAAQAAKAKAADPNAPRKATPEERAAASRMAPLVRAAFWQHEAQIDPNDVEANLGLSAALRALGKYDEAADVADRTIAIAPKNLEVLLESARTHIAAGHAFYAIQPLRQAEALAPKDWRPVSMLGVALEQDERPEEALAAYQQALKLSPNNPSILSNLALYHAVRGGMAEAERLLRQAAASPEASPQVRQNLALVLGLEGKTGEAEHLMRQDLPPETADANLAYLRGAAAPTAAPRAAAAPPPAPAAPSPPGQAPTSRTWRSLEASAGKGD